MKYYNILNFKYIESEIASIDDYVDTSISLLKNKSEFKNLLNDIDVKLKKISVTSKQSSEKVIENVIHQVRYAFCIYDTSLDDFFESVLTDLRENETNHFEQIITENVSDVLLSQLHIKLSIYFDRLFFLNHLNMQYEFLFDLNQCSTDESYKFVV